MTSLSASSDLSSSVLSWLSAIEPPCTGTVILQQSRKRARSAEILPPSKRRAKSLEVDMSGGGTQVSSWYSTQHRLCYADWNDSRSMDCHHQSPLASKAPKAQLPPNHSPPRTRIASSYQRPQAPFDRRWLCMACTLAGRSSKVIRRINRSMTNSLKCWRESVNRHA